MTGVVKPAWALCRGDRLQIGPETVTVHTITRSKDRVQLITGMEGSTHPDDAAALSVAGCFEFTVIGTSDDVMPVLGGAA